MPTSKECIDNIFTAVHEINANILLLINNRKGRTIEQQKTLEAGMYSLSDWEKVHLNAIREAFEQNVDI